MKYKISLVGKEGPNVVEYECISDTIVTLSQRELSRDDMRAIEKSAGLDSTLGVVSIQYQQRFPVKGKCITIWSVTEFADCDWE